MIAVRDMTSPPKMLVATELMVQLLEVVKGHARIEMVLLMKTDAIGGDEDTIKAGRNGRTCAAVDPRHLRYRKVLRDAS